MMINHLEKSNKNIKIIDKYKEKRLDNNYKGEEDENNFAFEMTAHDLKNIDMTCNFYNNTKENDLLREERKLILIQKEKDRLKRNNEKETRSKKNLKCK